MISFGNPPALKYDEQTKILSVKISEPKDEDPVVNNILDQLTHVTKANVCLSGGVDSQFALRVAKQLNIPVTAYTYLTTWDNSPINSDDVVTAELVAKKENVPLVKVEIDLKEFFESKKHLEYSRRFGTKSPQIAVHLYFIEKTFKDVPGTVFLGGEVPLMVKNSDPSEGPLDVGGISAGFFITSTRAYRTLCKELNIDLVRDLPLYTPQIIYKTLKASIDLVEEQQVHLELTDEFFHNPYAHKFKFLLYEKILPGGINPLVKNTGFEKLKKYLASQSGVYNQFDINYRLPIEHQQQKTKRNAQDDISGSVKYIAGTLPQQLTNEYREKITKYNSKCIYEYFFDF